MNIGEFHTKIRNNKWLPAVCLALSAFASACTYSDTDRYSEKGEGKVFVSLDWKGQALPTKTLFFFYPSGSNTPIERVGSSSGYEGVLPAGTYRVVVVNDESRNIVLQTAKGYDMAYAYSVSASGAPVAMDTRADEQVIILPPQNLYGIGLTDVQVDGTTNKVYTASPRTLVHPVKLDITIKGMGQVAAVEGKLTGVSPSVHIPSGESTYENVVAVPIPLEAGGEDRFHSTQTVFGLTPRIGESKPAEQNLLVLDIRLNDGTVFRNDLDITELIDESVGGSGGSSGSVEATIELELVVDATRPEGMHVQLVGWHQGTGWAGDDK